MKRIAITPRPDWQEKIRDQGFLYYDTDQYYNEQAAYCFSASEIDAIEKASVELFERCLEVVQYVIDHDLWEAFHIPRQFADWIRWSWKEDSPSFYGRFDLAYHNGRISLLEFNADTPTGLLEASVIQWYWLQEYNRSYDQFNSLHEKLVEHLKACRPYLKHDLLHFCCQESEVEDFITTKYLQDCADQAGIPTGFVPIGGIGLDEFDQFTTAEGHPIRNLFKLYPWEWLFREEFGTYLDRNREGTYWIEPPYKAILSNKMLLVYLHQLFPGHPHILPAYYGTARALRSFVQKPVFGREGANTTVVQDGRVLEQNGGEYGEEGYVFQAYAPLPEFDGNRVVIGSWLVGGEPAGMGLRESSGLITGNTSRFVPHFFT